jgi:hypothetical protein
MPDLRLVVAAGLFSLGGVILGALLMPFTQLFLERMREQRASRRAKLLIAGELLYAQMILRSASKLNGWLPVEDGMSLLPTSAWQEHRSSLVGHIDEDLYDQLVMAYALLETDRARFVMANRLPPETPLPQKEADGIKQLSNELGRLRRKLGDGGSGWPDEIQDELLNRIIGK